MDDDELTMTAAADDAGNDFAVQMKYILTKNRLFAPFGSLLCDSINDLMDTGLPQP